MQFGHSTKSLSTINWHLPEDPPLTKQFLASLSSYKTIPHIYVGCAVFTDPSFVGTVYPSQAKPDHYLSYYTQQFNALELNSTFYGIPTIKKILQWKKKSTSNFIFCPKFPKSISHRKNIAYHSSAIAQFLDNIAHFDSHLGIPFLQLSPYFHPKDFLHLEKFITLIPSHMSLAIELRHATWFSDEKNKDMLFHYLQKKNVVWIITDTNLRRDVLHQIITSDTVFIRFKANDLHASDFFRLNEWVKKLLLWISQGIKKVYFFIHTMQKHLSLILVDYFIKTLTQKNSKIHLKRPVKYTNQGQTYFL